MRGRIGPVLGVGLRPPSPPLPWVGRHGRRDLDEHPESPTGFLFDEFSSIGFAGAFERAALAFREPETWRRLQTAGMSHDFSWNASAKHYVDVYVAALRSRGVVPLE